LTISRPKKKRGMAAESLKKGLKLKKELRRVRVEIRLIRDAGRNLFHRVTKKQK